MTYRPVIEFQVQWDGTNWESVSGDTYNYDLKTGAEIAVDQQSIRVTGSRGLLELYNRGYKYSSEAPGAFNATALRRDNPARLMIDDVEVWRGIANPPRPAAIDFDHPRAIVRLQSKHYSDLTEYFEYTNLGTTTDSAVWNSVLSSRSVATSNNSFNNVPLGVITFTGTLRQFMSEYSRATDTYIIERANGDWSAINPRSAAARGTEAISGERFHIVKPLSEDYPRVGGVRNAAVTEVRAVTAQAEEDFFSVLETVAAGGTFSQTFVVDDDSIISISNWRAEKINDSQTDLTVTISGSGKTVTVTLQNTTGASIDAGYQIKGTPSRISTIRQFSITRPTSITQFGRKEDDIPNWLASTGLPSLNQRLNRIQQPLHFIRAKIPIWQNGKTQTTAIAAIRAGAIHRLF